MAVIFDDGWLEPNPTAITGSVVYPVTPRSTVLTWSFVPTLERLENYRVAVYRSLDPNDGFVTLAPAVNALQYVFIDTDPPELSKWATMYYRLAVYQVDAAGAEVPLTRVESKPRRVNQQYTPESLLLIEARQRHFKHLRIGRDSLIYRRRSSGQACPACWDAIEQRTTRQECPVCYGTGRLGGYYAPNRVLIQFQPAIRANRVGSAIMEHVYVDAAMGHFPLVSPRDVVLEIYAGKWYLVNQVRVKEHLRTVVMQQLTLKELDPQSKEQDLPIPASEQVQRDTHNSYLVTVQG